MYVDYDTFAGMSPLRKNDVLHKLTPENRAELVKTHLQRYLEENRPRLNDEQIRFIEENLNCIRPEHYIRRLARLFDHRAAPKRRAASTGSTVLIALAVPSSNPAKTCVRGKSCTYQ